MKYLLPFLTLTLLFSQELEVEGDLKVTGTVESATIDSLEQVIANLQAQIDAMQDAENKMETRKYTITVDIGINSIYEIDMLELTGYELDGAKLEFFKIENFTLGNSDYVTLNLEHSFYIYENSEPEWEKIIAECSSMVGGVDYGMNNADRVESIYFSGSNTIRFRTQSGSFSGDVSILVTAKFPD